MIISSRVQLTNTIKQRDHAPDFGTRWPRSAVQSGEPDACTLPAMRRSSCCNEHIDLSRCAFQPALLNHCNPVSLAIFPLAMMASSASLSPFLRPVSSYMMPTLIRAATAASPCRMRRSASTRVCPGSGARGCDGDHRSGHSKSTEQAVTKSKPPLSH